MKNMECSNPNLNFSKLRIIKNLTVISVSFLFLFTAYNGLATLQTTMNKKGGIGTISQAVLYISFGLSSIVFSSFVVKKLGTKYTQILAMVMYLPYVASNFYPSLLTLVPSAVIIGIGTTLLWGAQCTYFNECSILYRDITDSFENTTSTSCHNGSLFTSLSNQQGTELSELKVLHQAVGTKNPPDKGENSPYNHPDTNGNGVMETNGKQLKKISKESEERSQGIGESNPKWNSSFRSSGDVEDTEKKEKKCSQTCPKNGIQHMPNPKSKSSANSTNALIFGFHGMAYCSAHIWSNLISFYVLNSYKDGDNNKTSNCSCGASFCNTDQDCVSARIEEVPEDIRYYYTSICTASGILAVLLIWLFVDRMDKSKEKVTMSWHHVFATIKYVTNKEQLFIIPLTICTTMLQAFYMADFTKSYIACSWSTSHVGLVTVFYGVASALSSILSGLLIKSFGRKIILTLCQIINLVSLILLYLWIPEAQQPHLLYLSGALYGFIIGIYHTQNKALYGIFFEGDEETAFSSCNLYSSIGWALPFIYSEFLCTSVKICIMFAMASLGLVGYLFAERSFTQRHKQTYSFK